MSLNDETSRILKAGTMIGLAIMVAGLIVSLCDMGDLLLRIGILILIFSPMAGVIVSTKCLIQEKDRQWIPVALLLILIMMAGIVISYLT